MTVVALSSLHCDLECRLGLRRLVRTVGLLRRSLGVFVLLLVSRVSLRLTGAQFIILARPAVATGLGSCGLERSVRRDVY